MRRQLLAAGVFGALACAGMVSAMGPRGGGPYGGGGMAAPHAFPSLSGAQGFGQRPAMAQGPNMGQGGGQFPHMGGMQQRAVSPQWQAPSMQRPSGQGFGGPNLAAGQGGFQRPTSLPGGVHPSGSVTGQRPNPAMPGGGGGMFPQRPSWPAGGAARAPGAMPGLAGAGPQPGQAARPWSRGPISARPGGATVGGPGQSNVRPNPGGLMGTGNRPGQGPGIVGNLPVQGGNFAGGGIRPGQGGSGTPYPGGIVNRPGGQGGGPQWAGGPNRPGQGGSGGQRPWANNRPGSGGSVTPGGIVNLPGGQGGGSQLAGGSGGAANRPFQFGDGGRGPGNSRPGQGGGGEQRPWANNGPGDGGWRPGNNGTGPRPGGIWGNGSNNQTTGNLNTGNINSGNAVNNISNNSVTNNTVLSNNQNWVNNNQNWGSVNQVGAWGGSAVGAVGSAYPGYYPGAYGNWHAGSWSNWPTTPALWTGAAATAGWLGATAAQSYTYSNPFAANLAATSFDPSYSYSDPLPTYVEPQSSPTVVINQGDTAYVDARQAAADVPATPGITVIRAEAPAAETPPQAAPEDPKVARAVALFDEGRGLFKGGDYAGAENKVDRAIAILPADRVLHEFRALTLFAQARYRDAAAPLYAVLSAGPGWNWQTLSEFYPDTAIYTRQLRALEADARKNLKSSDDRFVLAYHYFVLGHKDAALKILDQVHTLLPDDHLVTQLLAALKPPPHGDDGTPEPGTG